MNNTSVFRFIFLFLVLLLPNPSFAGGFSSPNVPVDDPVYRQIDKLIAFGLIKDAIYGQRPWSRNEIARLIGEAMRHREEMPPPMAPDDREISARVAADDLLEGMKKEYREELIDRGNIEGEGKAIRIHPLEQVRFDYTILESPFRAVPASNGIGTIDAVINPLVSNREGRHFVDGSALGLETTHRANLSKFFSVYARPRLELLVPNTGSSDVNLIVQQLYGKMTIKNVELEVGRDAMIWGHGTTGGVFASDNTRGMDMLKISNDSPFFHPWIFRYLGPSKYTFFIGNLGPEYIIKNAFVYGLSASIKPFSMIELGFEHQVTVAGDGAPHIGVVDLISEFFLVRRSGAHNNSGPNLADHRFGLNLRFHIPPLRNSVFYAEGIFEDFGRESFWPQFVEQMGFQAGLYFPLLTADGSNDLRIEYEHIPPAFARHGTWTSGLTLNQRLRGSETGPDGQSLLVEWNHDFSNQKRLKTVFQYDNRDSDTYTTTASSVGGPNRVVKVTDNRTEHRLRLLASLDWRAKPWLLLRPEIGYERVVNFNFIQGSDRNNFLGGIGVTFSPFSR